MGLELAYITFINAAMDHGGAPYVGRMCELGNQRIRESAQAFIIETTGCAAATGKEYFQRRGGRWEHVSIDQNGLDGSLACDLSQPIHGMDVQFDVVTNSGTSEHVSDQYQCFANIHRFTKPGGLMIHLVPESGHWHRHGRYHYTFGFFFSLASMCGYTLRAMDRIAAHGRQSQLVCVALQRAASPVGFISRFAFDTLSAGTLDGYRARPA